MTKPRRPTDQEINQIASEIAFEMWVNPSEDTDNREITEAHYILQEASITVIEPEAAWLHELNVLAIIDLPTRDLVIVAELWKNGSVELVDLTSPEETKQG